MKKATKVEGQAMGCALGVLLLAVGVIVLLAIPVVGWVIGPLIIIVALFCGGKRRPVWQCRSCRSVIARG